MNVAGQYITDYYRSHLTDIRLYIYRCTGDREVAKDLAQDAFVRLLGIDNIISAKMLPALVFRIVRNIVTDYFRKHTSRMEYEHFVTGDVLSGQQFSVYSMFDVTEHLERGIARLPENCRKVYCMNLLDGMKVSEISKSLGVSYKVVEHRLGFARKEIRRYMAPMAG